MSLLLDRDTRRDREHRVRCNIQIAGKTWKYRTAKVVDFEVWPPQVSEKLIQTLGPGSENCFGEIGFPAVKVAMPEVTLPHPTGELKSSFVARASPLESGVDLLLGSDVVASFGELIYLPCGSCRLTYPKTAEFTTMPIDQLKSKRVLVLGADANKNIFRLNQIESTANLTRDLGENHDPGRTDRNPA